MRGGGAHKRRPLAVPYTLTVPKPPIRTFHTKPLTQAYLPGDHVVSLKLPRVLRVGTIWSRNAQQHPAQGL